MTEDLNMTNNLEQIHDASMTILERCGMKFADHRVLELMAANGFKVSDETVYFQREKLMSLIKKAPESFTLHARNPQHNMILGGNRTYYAPGYGAPALIDFDGSRRQAQFDDYITFLKLVQASDCFHINGGILVQPSDLNPETAFASMLHAAILHSDKCLISGGGRADENRMVMEMMAILCGGEDTFRSKPHILALINTTSPLMMDAPSIETLITFIEHGQPIMITPATMAGTTGPVTLAGTIALANAEVLAGIALTQMIRPGAPVMFGFQADTADMRSGSIGRGSPEGALCFTMGAKLAKWYGLPCRGGGSVSCAKNISVQAGYEGMLTLLATSQAKMNLIIHSAGMMDADAAVSFEKFMVDLEIIGMIDQFLKGVPINSETLALDVIEQVGPAGEFLTQMHTMTHCRNASFVPTIGLRGNKANENPNDALKEKILRKMENMLQKYKMPELSSSVKSQLNDYLKDHGVKACTDVAPDRATSEI